MTLRGVLSKERLSIHGYFNQEYIDTIIERFIDGDDTLTFKIWTLIISKYGTKITWETPKFRWVEHSIS